MKKKSNHRIAKNIVRVISFICLSSILYVYSCFVFIAKPQSNPDIVDYVDMRGFKGEEKNTIEVLGLGTSTMMFGLIPMEMYEEYGISFYNSSLSRNTLENELGLFKECLDCQKPKVLLLDEEALWDYGIAKYQTSTPSLLTSSFWNHQELASLKPRNFYDLKSNYDDLFFNAFKGYVFTNATTPIHGIGFDDYDTIYPFNDEAKLNIINTIIQIAKEKDIAVVIVEMPVGKDSLVNYSGFFADYARRKEINYLNLSGAWKEIGLDETVDFWNILHLNYRGALKTTRYFSNYLNTNFQLTDYRETKKNKKMERSLSVFKKFLKTAGEI